MKNNLLLMVSMLICSASISALASDWKEIPSDHIYSPKGFDDNDNVEVVVTGYLPNLCYRSPRAEVHFAGPKIIEISLESLYQAPSERDIQCAQMLVPFVLPVSLGLLDSGDYTVIVGKGTFYEQQSKMKVEHSTSDAIDDFIYAGVEYVEVKSAGQRVVELKGHNPSYCFELDHIEYISNNKDTYSILPIMKKISSNCPRKLTAFAYEWTVPEEINRDKVLLHVRSMDGRSINRLFDPTWD